MQIYSVIELPRLSGNKHDRDGKVDFDARCRGQLFGAEVVVFELIHER